MKKALLIAYHFPPIRLSSGIQRTLSLTRYLNEHGWHPSVLSIVPRAYEKVSDDQLADVPAHIEVKRAAGWDTARHLSIGGRYLRFMAMPDRWVSWVFGGVASGLAMIRKNKPDVIWSTYPIATAHLIGLALHRLTGIPWIADCRDSMTEEDYPTNPTQRKIYQWIEKQAVKRASRMIFTTQGTRQMYMARYPQVDPGHFVVIPNGYDEEIFLAAEQGLVKRPVQKGKLTLVHSGVLYPSERDPTAFFDALAELKQEEKISADKLNIVLRATGHDNVFQPMLQQRAIDDLVTLVPGVSYNEALQEMLTVDGLLLFQAANCNHQVPAKLYEYFRAAKPVFALTDKTGNTAETLREAGIDDIVDLANKNEIKQQLVTFLTQLETGAASIANPEVASSYSRQALTVRFAKAFNEVANCG
jgi:glycosyltransferase involved in cell wall biosynthesis